MGPVAAEGVLRHSVNNTARTRGPAMMWRMGCSRDTVAADLFFSEEILLSKSRQQSVIFWTQCQPVAPVA